MTEKPEPNDTPQTMENRVAALEKQVQTLMQAMVEKDNRIAELQRKLDELAARKPGLPGLQFRGTPRELDQMWRNWRRDFFRDDPEDEDVLGPWRRDVPLQPDWPRGRMRGKPRLGVTLAEPTPALAEQYRNESKTGAFVTQVLPNSAAEKAGVKEGDCITAFDDQPAIEVNELIRLIQAAAPGRHTLTLKRRGEALKLSVQLGGKADGDAHLLNPRHRLDRGWLKRDRDADGVQETLVVKSSALEVTPRLAAEMMLSGEQREKMVGVLKKHAEQVSKEYADLAGAGVGVATNNAVLEPMIDKHVAVAEEELKGVLDEKQLAKWRDYRAKNKRLSVSRSLKVEGRHEPEGLDF